MLVSVCLDLGLFWDAASNGLVVFGCFLLLLVLLRLECVFWGAGRPGMGVVGGSGREEVGPGQGEGVVRFASVEVANSEEAKITLGMILESCTRLMRPRAWPLEPCEIL